MSFRVRSLLEVLDGMLATVLANSEITDVNRGAIDRIILEAAALQDADQYLQIARLKNSFSIETATGVDLDDRGADFDIDRRTPTQATGLVKFSDKNFTTKVETTLNGVHLAGSGTLTLTSAASFPNSGSVVLERDTPGQRELVTYSAKLGNVLTLSTPTTLNHLSLTSVILSTVGADRVFPANAIVSVPATDSTEQLDYSTQSAVTLFDGDVVTGEVTVLSTLTGADLNVGTGQISTLANPPFQTAAVYNDAPMQGGHDEESDSEYRQRIKQTIAALSNGTINDLLVAATAVSLPSGQRVITAQVVEEFTDPDVSVYIDDGTGTVTTTAFQAALELLIHKAEPGQRRSRVSNWPVVTGTLSLKRSFLQGGVGSPTQINSVVPGVGTALCNVTAAGFTPAALVGLTVIDDNRNSYVISANGVNDFTVTVPPLYPNPVPGSYAILTGTFLAPQPADVVSVHAAHAASGANTFPGPITNPDVPRTLQVFFSTGWDGGAVTILGTDASNSPIVEVFPAMSNDTRVGLRVFKTVTSITKATVGTTGTASVGRGATLLSPYLIPGVDFVFNETTGDIELTVGLVLNSTLAAVPNLVNAYSYYTGLIQLVQKVLNGDPADLDNYPGVKAAGVKLKVRAPTVQNISFNITVISTFGTTEADLIASVQDVVQRYVNALGVGEDVILAEVIAAVMGVAGVIDVRVNSPSTNVVVLDGVLPRTKSSLITVL